MFTFKAESLHMLKLPAHKKAEAISCLFWSCSERKQEELFPCCLLKKIILCISESNCIPNLKSLHKEKKTVWVFFSPNIPCNARSSVSQSFSLLKNVVLECSFLSSKNNFITLYIVCIEFIKCYWEFRIMLSVYDLELDDRYSISFCNSYY